LSISDNGIGVRSSDLPYIFEKGFTGNSGDGRKKATGMGLYLAKEIAKDLNILLNVESNGERFYNENSFSHCRQFAPLRDLLQILYQSVVEKPVYKPYWSMLL